MHVCMQVKLHIHVYMLGAKHGFRQSIKCAVQSMDLHFVQAIHGLPWAQRMHMHKLHRMYLRNLHAHVCMDKCKY